jgi:lipopolysaccharide export system permease protein
LLLTLYNGRSYFEMQKEKKEERHIKSYPLRRDKFQEQEMIIEMTGFGLNRTDENLFRNSYQMMNLSQLHHFDDSLTNEIDDILDKFNRQIDISLTRKPNAIMIKREFAERLEQADTTGEKRETIVQQVNVDSAYAELNQLERRRAITHAINVARTNKSIVSSNVGTSDWKWARLRRYQIEIHRKFTLSVLCLIFFFIGAPLGAIIRKGGLGMPVIVSVLLFLVYYILSITAEKFVRESIVPPFVGMWISTLILVPVSIWLTIKAANDSVILHIETYFSWWKKWTERVAKFFRIR